MASASLPPAAPAPANGISDFGPLTEVSSLRRAAEEFRRISPDLPADAGENAVPRQRVLMAERRRQRGAKLVDTGRPAAAIAAFTEATRLDPRNAAAHHALGRALIAAGRAAEAAESLRLATALRDDPAAYCDLALALRQQGRNGDAIAA